jgi:hypothetical protein
MVCSCHPTRINAEDAIKNSMEQTSSSKISNWSAPASLVALNDSGWHVQQIRRKGFKVEADANNGQNGWNVSRRNVFQAGHFRLTGHGDALDARINLLPTGRTPGRALRAFRRKLQRNPIAFA